jgi:hypothetical protein
MKGFDLLPFAARTLRQIREFAGMSMFFYEPGNSGKSDYITYRRYTEKFTDY